MERQVIWHRLDEGALSQRRDGSVASSEAARALRRRVRPRLQVIAAAAAGDPIVEPVLVKECESWPWRGGASPSSIGPTARACCPASIPGPGTPCVATTWPPGPPGPAGRPAPRSSEARPAKWAAASGRWWRPPRRRRPTPVAQLAASDGRGGHEPPSEAVVAVLAEHHVDRAEGLAALDPTVVALADEPIRGLAGAIHGARVITEGSVAERRHGVPELVVPSADVEIDIDMENAVDGTVYLWGPWWRAATTRS
ncbi:MAG: hypothetical protein R2746_12940 [Acidimicrobiales bacterium]